MNSKIFLAGFLIPSFMGFISCRQQGPSAEPEKTVTVRVEQVRKAPYRHPVLSSGRLASKHEARLSFKTGGIIGRIFVREGERVRKDQPLAALRLDEVQAQVAQAELNYDKSLRDLERVTNLYHDSVATLEQLQNATTAIKVAESALKIARFNLQYSTITSPADGQILRRLAEEDEMASPGYPVLLFAPMNETMVVRVHLTDREVVNITQGDSAWIRFDAWPGERFAASVTEIAGTSDPYTGTYEVELSLRETTSKLISGFIARAEILPSENEVRFFIPVNALTEGNGSTGRVYLLKGSQAVSTLVRIDRIDGDRLVVFSGVQEGDSVITHGWNDLEKGARIIVQR
ncbi:MAG: efflux RND transporter periplasmic adaptor subunit [Bacteroidales bacterium]|nr:efflux RND transporter periplasmic adaptor subunit [Bacteroidales bacterium]